MATFLILTVSHNKKQPMKINLTLALIILFAINLFGQSDTEKLNAYRFAFLQKLTYQDGGIDSYGLASRTASFLQNRGFYILNDDKESWPKEATYNPCEILNVLVNNKSRAKVFIEFKNCKGEIIYKDNAHATNWNNNYRDNFSRSLDNIFKSFKDYKLEFNRNETPVVEYPTVEQTGETEITLKEYFDNNNLNAIEGIYKSYQALNLPHYKIGIKKQNDKYIAIILEADEYSPWKKGEVKAYFEPSSMSDFFSTKWYMGNKISYETYAMMENGALLSIEFLNPKTKEKRQDKFIKMYPTASGEIKNKKPENSISATGSGFILDKKGVIATNAHVVENADKIQITIKNEIGENIYSAKVLLKDKMNDVALLEITDSKFTGFNELPYKISENTEIGENVFTIGFPLNSIMGKNFKVNNGIVSSNTGISDDIRHYQISVPLQPGNSGGPLFNENGNVIGITSSRLNGKAIGTSVQNVNYAIKSAYVLNLIKMLPDVKTPTGNSRLNGKDLKEKVKVLKNYVCLITVY